MRVLMGCLVVAFCVAADEKKEAVIDGKKLVGRWQPKEKKEAVIEYRKDGTMLLTVSGEKEFKAEGTYAIDGNKVTATVKLGEKEQKSVRTVTKLTDTELVTNDDTGMERKFERVKEKIDPKLLVGRWEPKPKLKFAVVAEYTKGGKFIHTVTGDGPERRTECDYVVDGNQLNKSERFDDGRESSYTDTIISLTDTDLVISQGPNRSNLHYVRIKDKK